MTMADLKESRHLKALKDKLREMFQLDQADLDFGIYRIMNQKRDEIERFLDKDLLPQVREALQEYQPADLVETQRKLEKAIEGAKAAGIDPEQAPSVRQLRAELEDSIDISKLEEEVYSHLSTFFSRYYQGGDFLSLRRYKEGVYALPYEGEEVKLHWANADQYYIKSTEAFRSYAFKVPQTIPAEPGMTGSIRERRVRFDLVSAGTERDNTKAASGKERRFILDQDVPLEMDGDELVIRFHYRPDDEKRKQKDLNAEATEALLGLPEGAPATNSVSEWEFWRGALSEKAPTDANGNRTVLEKHLTNYTARNSFDYFIHKDLGGFLRRELDFFIKNEVMFLDDIQSDTAPRVEQYLSKIKVLRSIGQKIIDFLASLEDFQKKLWLKKKFVLETNWLVTLDKVPEDLYAAIAANDAQREEWVKLFAIDKIGQFAGISDTQRSLGLEAASPTYSAPLTIDFLKANPFLVVDTAFFDQAFKDALLASFEDIEEETGGLLVHGENFQALNLLRERYREQIKCVYIDPPYNTDAAPIMYKNGYKDSSWLSLIGDRLSASLPFIHDQTIYCVTIDDVEFHLLRCLVNERIRDFEALGVAPIKNNPAGRTGTVGFSVCHEYGLFYGNPETARIGRLEHSDAQKARYKERDDIGHFEWTNFRKHGGENTFRIKRPRQFYPIYVSDSGVRIPKLEWDNASREYIVHERPLDTEEVLYPIDNQGRERIWDFVVSTARENIEHLDVKKDSTGKLAVYRKWRINDDGLLPPSWWGKSEYSAAEYGTNLLSKMFGETHAFTFPKSVHAVEDCLRVSGAWHDREAVVLDYFSGSGTTAHAIINFNKKDGGRRKYVMVEMGDYFDAVTKSRVQKASFSSEWKSGQPVSRDGISHLAKYIRLESYEDCLDNLALTRKPDQAKLVEEHDRLREDYMLHYMLNLETEGSVLDIRAFSHPFDYTLSVLRDDERTSVPVDLVETFNYLLGLRVKTRDRKRGVLEIVGLSPEGETVLVLWRNVDEVDNDALDDWFQKQGYNARDLEFQTIYVNGDNNIENQRRPDETWKVRLIEEYFHKLMFDVEGV